VGERQSSTSRTLLIILINGIAAGCLIWTLREARLSEIGDDLAKMHWWWVALAFAAQAAVYLVQAWRWALLLRPVVLVRFWQSARALYIGIFANEILPLRVGELLRCYLLSRWTKLPFSVSLSSAVIERVFDGIWLYVCMLVMLQIVTIPEQLRYLARATYVLGLVVLAGAVVLVIAFTRRRKNVPSASQSKWRRHIGILMQDLRLIGHSRFLGVAFVQSLPFLLIQAVPIWASFKGYGFGLPLTAAFALTIILRLASSLPQAPGNLGIFQILTKEVLEKMFGLPPAEAARFSLVLWCVMTFPLVAAGAISLAVTEAKIGELTRAAEKQALELRAQS
jgi:uncharacterized protein (TIRG00374 family)